MKLLVTALSRSRFHFVSPCGPKNTLRMLLSMPITQCPWPSKYSTASEPIRPLLPVTRMVFRFNFALPSYVGSHARTKLSLLDDCRDRSLLRCNGQQTITPPKAILAPKNWEQYKPGKNHEKQGQEGVPHLAGLLALPRKEMDEERLGDPQRRSDLAQLDFYKAGIFEQSSQSLR